MQIIVNILGKLPLKICRTGSDGKTNLVVVVTDKKVNF